MHPIFQWLDYRYQDYGGFARATDDRWIGGFRNRFIAGVNLHNGTIDNQQFRKPARRGERRAAVVVGRQIAEHLCLLREFVPLPAERRVRGRHAVPACGARPPDRFLTNGDQSGQPTFDILSPKVGLLWDVDPAWQVFANISRSAEVPSFGENSFATAALSSIRAQTATTYEIGTRGRRPDCTWDLAIYRAEIRNELQCLTNPATPGAAPSPTPTAPSIRASRPASASRSSRVEHAGRPRLAERRLYFNDFFFDGDARYGNNRLPGAPPHYVRAELLYKHPNGFYAGPNVEWVPQAVFRRQRQQRDDGALCAAELPGRLRSGRRAGQAMSKAATSSTRATSQAPVSPKRQMPLRPCSTRYRPCGICRRPLPQMKTLEGLLHLEPSPPPPSRLRDALEPSRRRWSAAIKGKAL